MTWNRIPGELVNKGNSTSVNWEGPGWYASAREVPGGSTYTLTRVGEGYFGNYKNPTANELDAVVRSFGHGTLRWMSEPG